MATIDISLERFILLIQTQNFIINEDQHKVPPVFIERSMNLILLSSLVICN